MRSPAVCPNTESIKEAKPLWMKDSCPPWLSPWLHALLSQSLSPAFPKLPGLTAEACSSAAPSAED